MSEKKIRIGNKEFEVLGSMQEIMAEVELRKSGDGLTSDELLDKAPFGDRGEVVDTLRFLEGKGKVRYDTQPIEVVLDRQVGKRTNRRWEPVESL